MNLNQIKKLIPSEQQYLQSMGIQMAPGELGGDPIYFNQDGEVVQPGQIQELMGDYQNHVSQTLRSQGIADANDNRWSAATVAALNKQHGTNFTPESYLQHIYGPGVQKVGDYIISPTGNADQFVNNPLSYTAPKSMGGQLVKAGILGLAGAGLTGMLPGTESIFSGFGGAGAAEAAPAFTGGAGGGGAIAGAASGGGALSGLTAAEAAAIGAGGAGLSDVAGSAASQAIDGSMQTIYDAMANAGAPGYDAALASGVNAASSLPDWIKNAFPGKSTSELLGILGSSGLGLLGSNAQQDAFSDNADKYLAIGAPFRDKLQQSYDPGFSMADQPDFMNALDIGAQAAARATSARHGNPVDNPGAYSEMQKYISGSLALPQLNTYRSQLGTFGGLGVNTAGTSDYAAASQEGGAYDAIGSGLASLTKPKNPYEDVMKGLLGGFKLNQGYSF